MRMIARALLLAVAIGSPELLQGLHAIAAGPLALLVQTEPPPPPPPPPPPIESDQPQQVGKIAAKVPEFAVTSVKPTNPETRMFRLMTPPDGFSTTNVPLKTLIEFAWNVSADRISGAPSWIDHANYDIEAKVDAADIPVMKELTQLQRREMIRKLLEDRFALKVHEETKELPVYALVVAKGGPRLHEAKPGDTYSNGFAGPDGKSGSGAMMFNGKQITAQGLPIKSLVPFLSQQLGRVVIDKTGLSGKYDFTLDLPAGQRSVPTAKPPDGSDAGANGASDDSEPSIFTLVQDQLGLKLESTKAPLPIVVIDQVQRPSAN